MSSQPPPGWKRPGGIPHPGDAVPGQPPPGGPPPPPPPRPGGPSGPPPPPGGYRPGGPGGPSGPGGPGGPQGPGGSYQAPGGGTPGGGGGSKVPLIVAIVVGLAVLGGAAFFFVNRSGTPVAVSTDDPTEAATATEGEEQTDPAVPPTEDGGGKSVPTEATRTEPGATESTDPPIIDGEEEGSGRVIDTVDQVLTEEVGDYTLTRRINDELADTGAIDSAELLYDRDPRSRKTRVVHFVGIYESQSDAVDRVRRRADSLTPPFVVGDDRELAEESGEVYGHLITLNNDSGNLAFVIWSNRNVFFILQGGTDADLQDFYNQLPY